MRIRVRQILELIAQDYTAKIGKLVRIFIQQSFQVQKRSFGLIRPVNVCLRLVRNGKNHVRKVRHVAAVQPRTERQIVIVGMRTAFDSQFQSRFFLYFQPDTVFCNAGIIIPVDVEDLYFVIRTL